ncbi:MAG: hypothetical protein QNI95_10540 [Desulfobacterales bacterium]|nr:hypothetical protein [Desulfobacterales bacterium]
MKESNANTIDEALISQNDIDQLLKDVVEPDEPAGSSDIVENTQDAETQAAPLDPNKGPNSAKPQQKGDLDSSLGQAQGPQATDTHHASAEKANKATGTKEIESSLVSQDDLDALLSDTSEQAQAKDDEAPDRIILEEPDEEEPAQKEEPDPAPNVKSPTKPMVKGRKKRSTIILVIAGISMFVVGGWVILKLLNRTHEPETQPVQRFQIVTPKAAKSLASRVMPKPLTDDNLVQLEEFVVFAPPEKPGITFLRLKVSLTMNDPMLARKIKANRVFYRSIIFNRLNDVVATKHVREIEPRRIEKLLVEALRPSLPGRALKKIMFTKFIVT